MYIGKPIYTKYRIEFPTLFISDLAKRVIVDEINAKRNETFAVIEGIPSSSSLCGAMFEDLCHSLLGSKMDLVDLPFRILSVNDDVSYFCIILV